jgi:L-ascorbate metabolism protein UlaG (beta-lactamase superfamily)
LEGISFCHLGDIGHIPSKDLLAEIGRVDVLLVPVGGIFTVDARVAWDIVEAVKPRIAIPMHYRVTGLSLPLANLSQFTDGHEDQVVNVGNEIDIEKGDLPDQFEVWTFSLY